MRMRTTKRRHAVALAMAGLLAGAALLAGCSEDTSAPPPPPKSTGFENLTEVWHPLNNLEMSYIQRNIDRYSDALDADYYRFYYSTAVPASERGDTYWTYDQDTQGMRLMFDAQLPNLNMRVVNMEFDLVFDKDALNWVEVAPGDPPNETWYTTVVPYTFYLKLGSGDEYGSKRGATAQITVRQHPDDDRWRIVGVADLATSLVRR